MSPPKSDNDDDYDDVPLQYQRPFGAGLHRKPITFVSASGAGQLQSVDDAPVGRPHHNVADLYLSMVLPADAQRSRSAPPSSNGTSSSGGSTAPPEPETCAVCRLPLGADRAAHKQSFAHQVCLPHSPPPSALDRTRMGLAYLSAHGWDPDARRGLGAAQQGIQFPVKARVKDDSLGLGMELPKKPGQGLAAPERKKERSLDAKKVRKAAAEEKKRAARIREELFGDGRLEKYLGAGKAG